VERMMLDLLVETSIHAQTVQMMSYLEIDPGQCIFCAGRHDPFYSQGFVKTSPNRFQRPVFLSEVCARRKVGAYGRHELARSFKKLASGIAHKPIFWQNLKHKFFSLFIESPTNQYFDKI
jgi:hypothetical protein